jgi:hypothetical protein
VGTELLTSGLLALVASALASDPGCREAANAGDLDRLVEACADCATHFCSGRLEWLERRRDPDGGIAGVQALERARRTSESAGELHRISRDEAISPVVRADASCALARAAATPGEAFAILQPFLPNRAALPEEVRRPLVSLASKALAGLGRDDEARALNAEIHPSGSGVSEVDVAIRARRERAGAAVAAAGVAGFAAVILPSALRRREIGWGGPLLGGFAFLAWALAEAWERGAGAPIATLAAVLLPFHLLCAAGVGAAPRWWFRIGAFASTLALSWLALWGTGQLPW